MYMSNKEKVKGTEDSILRTVPGKSVQPDTRYPGIWIPDVASEDIEEGMMVYVQPDKRDGTSTYDNGNVGQLWIAAWQQANSTQPPYPRPAGLYWLLLGAGGGVSYAMIIRTTP